MNIIAGDRRGVAFIKTSYNAVVVNKLRGIPSARKWDTKRKVWSFHLSRASVQYLRDQFPDAVWDASLNEYLTRLELEDKKAARVREEKLRDIEVTDFKFRLKPFAHQMTAFGLSRDMEAFALFMEMGTGKTKVILDTAGYLHTQGRILGLLVVAPNTVKYNWLNEVSAHLPEYIHHRCAVWESTPRKAEREALEYLFDPGPELRVLVMNYEAFTTKKGKEFAERFLDTFTAMMALDESTRIKTPGRVRTRAIRNIGKKAAYRRILTGSPITKSPMDLYSQFAFLDPDILGFSNFYSFRNRYAIMGGYENKEIVAYDRIEELQESIEGHSYRVLKKDCLDLPDKVYETREVELSKEQREAYKSMAKTLVAELPDGRELNAEIALTKLLRLQQIVGGAGFDDNPRIEALNEIVHEALQGEGKIIIWARFREEIAEIVDVLRYTLGSHDIVEPFHGDVKKDRRVEILDIFQRPEAPLRILVGQVQVGGIGLNLTEATTVVYYSNTFSLEDRLQSEDRAHRIGQTNKVTYIDLCADVPMDRKIIKALRTKHDIASEVMKDGIKDWI